MRTASRSVLAASMAAIKLNQRLLAELPPESIAPVGVRCAISAGPITIAGVGGVDGERRLFVTGPAICDLAVAGSKAKVGAIAIAACAWDMAGGALVGRRSAGGPYILRRVANPTEGELEQVAAKSGVSDLSGAQAYVPKNVRRLSEPALVELAAELRTTTMVFCRFKEQQFSDRAEIHKINDAIRSVQEECNRYHGLLETVRADDKGTTFMVAFGLPPRRRRTGDQWRSALHITSLRFCSSTGYEPGIGIATGRVFQGPIGVAHRRQFAFIGSPTILGCRLMQVSNNEVLCDEETKALAEIDGAPWGV